MDSMDTFLPMTLWILATGASILILIVVLSFYAYQKKRFEAGLQDFGDVANLSAQIDLLQARKDELVKWINTQNAELERKTGERHEQEILRAELQRLEQECAAKDEGNQALRNEVGELENQRHVLTQTLERLNKEIKEIGNIEQIDGDISEKKEQLNKLTDELNSKRNEQDIILRSVTENKIAIESLENKKTKLEIQNGQFQEETEKSKEAAKEARYNLSEYKEEVQKQRDEVEKSKKDLDNDRKEKVEIELIVSKLREEERSLKHDNEQMKKDLGQPMESDVYSDLLDIEPTCLSKEQYSDKTKDMNEETYLENFKDQLRQEKYYFSERVIDAFHTSLKCHDINPLTVLAGVSGTGKSLLPLKYAEFMGIHSLEIAVQPRWDSPQDMFGFYNYLEKKFKATELSRALIRFDSYNFPDQEANYNWVKDHMLIVMLDEMNLARIEYYFSEILSKLEFRRVVCEENKSQRVKAEIEFDTGPNRKEPLRVWIPRNVLFVGTMNEDETTQALSEKVLDRANVLRFGKPEKPKTPLEVSGDTTGANDKYLSIKEWLSWQRKYDKEFEKYKQTEEIIKNLNNALEKINKPFGFRVQDSIGTYIRNYPQVENEGRYNFAIADQIEQKIMPKLNGMEMGMDEKSTQCLADIEKVIKETNDVALDEAFEKAKENGQRLGMFKWQGITRTIT
jgi:hypothetical protein